MNTIRMTEQALIDTCKKMVEEKLNLPGNGSWKQRDFQYLSDLIFEKTNTRISLSTLKRIWKNEDNRTPQLYTLNALAHLLDYKSWNEFRKAQIPAATFANSPEPSTLKEIYRNPKRIYWLVVPVVLLLGLLAFLYFKPHSGYDPATVVFKSKKNVATGVPNTVVFEYDISKIDFDSAFIQHTWDERKRARVSKENHFQTFIYYYPGFHSARLTIDGKIVKREKVSISTIGWEAVIDDEVSQEVPRYMPKNEIVSDGRLYVSREMLTKQDIPVENKNYFINYFNVGNLDSINAANFTLETRIKNDPAEGALVCQYSQVTLICENGMISLPFCYPGCASKIHLHVGEVFRDGNKNDLSPFGCDLSTWRNIKIKTSGKKVIVSIDDKPIYDLTYTKDLGKIAGFHYKFYGSGSVDMINLRNAQDKLIYQEDF
jgi:hypothetical protein